MTSLCTFVHVVGTRYIVNRVTCGECMQRSFECCLGCYPAQKYDPYVSDLDKAAGDDGETVIASAVAGGGGGGGGRTDGDVEGASLLAKRITIAGEPGCADNVVQQVFALHDRRVNHYLWHLFWRELFCGLCCNVTKFDYYPMLRFCDEVSQSPSPCSGCTCVRATCVRACVRVCVPCVELCGELCGGTSVHAWNGTTKEATCFQPTWLTGCSSQRTRRAGADLRRRCLIARFGIIMVTKWGCFSPLERTSAAAAAAAAAVVSRRVASVCTHGLAYMSCVLLSARCFHG